MEAKEKVDEDESPRLSQDGAFNFEPKSSQSLQEDGARKSRKRKRERKKMEQENPERERERERRERQSTKKVPK